MIASRSPSRMLFRIARSFLVQIICIATLLFTSRFIPLVPILFLVGQVLLIILFFSVLREKKGIILANLLFPLLITATIAYEIPQYLLFSVAFLLLLIFYPVLKTGVPLFTSSHEAAEKFIAFIPKNKAITIAELGAGEGRFSSSVATARPNSTVLAFEVGPLSFCILLLRTFFHKNIKALRKDFFQLPWNECEIIYCFLAPPLMPAVWEKFTSETRPGTLLVSNAFPVPDAEPFQIIPLKSKLEAHLFIYKR